MNCRTHHFQNVTFPENLKVNNTWFQYANFSSNDEIHYWYKKKKSWNGKFPINTVSHFPHTSTIRQIDKSKKKVRKFREVEAPAQTVEGSSFQTGHSSTRTTSMTPGVHQKEQARAAVFGAVADPWEDWGEGLGNKEWIYIGKQKVYIFRNIEYNNLPLVIHSSIYQSTSTILVSILPIYCHSTNEWGAELWSSD